MADAKLRLKPRRFGDKTDLVSGGAGGGGSVGVADEAALVAIPPSERLDILTVFVESPADWWEFDEQSNEALSANCLLPTDLVPIPPAPTPAGRWLRSPLTANIKGGLAAAPTAITPANPVVTVADAAPLVHTHALAAGATDVGSTPTEIDQVADLSVAKAVNRTIRSSLLVIPGGGGVPAAFVLPARVCVRKVWLDVVAPVASVLSVGVAGTAGGYLLNADVSVAGFVDGPVGVFGFDDFANGGATVLVTGLAPAAGASVRVYADIVETE